MGEKVILAAIKISVNAIYDKIMAKLPGNSVNYLFIDIFMNREDAVH